MNLVQINNTVNQVERAEKKLDLHKQKGQGSALSIFQVARLMDVVRMGKEGEIENPSLFFSLN